MYLEVRNKLLLLLLLLKCGRSGIECGRFGCGRLGLLAEAIMEK